MTFATKEQHRKENKKDTQKGVFLAQKEGFEPSRGF